MRNNALILSLLTRFISVLSRVLAYAMNCTGRACVYLGESSRRRTFLQPLSNCLLHLCACRSTSMETRWTIPANPRARRGWRFSVTLTQSTASRGRRHRSTGIRMGRRRLPFPTGWTERNCCIKFIVHLGRRLLYCVVFCWQKRQWL